MSATLQQKMQCLPTVIHTHIWGGITFQLVTRAQHLYPSSPNYNQINLFHFRNIFGSKHYIYILLFVCLEHSQLIVYKSKILVRTGELRSEVHRECRTAVQIIKLLYTTKKYAPSCIYIYIKRVVYIYMYTCLNSNSF